jgi:hypothetical protein
MIDLIGFSLVGLLRGFLEQEPVSLEPLPLFAWQDAKIFALPIEPDPTVANKD